MVTENIQCLLGLDMLEDLKEHFKLSLDLHQMSQIQEWLLMERKHYHYGKLNKMNTSFQHIQLKRKTSLVILLRKSLLNRNHNNCGHMHTLDITMEISNITSNGLTAKLKNNSKVGMLLLNIGHYIWDKD